jgi:hypothetical protein
VRKPFLRGGSEGNEQLTAVVGTLLVVLLAAEGATLLDLRGLLTVHAFVGMLLIPVVVLKLASTGWRMARYYLRGEEYVRRGPPHLFLRALVAPLMVVSTIVVFGTGVLLLALGQAHGTLVGLHKASFIVWLGMTGVHVLARLPRVMGALRRRTAGTAQRLVLAGGAVFAGLALATLTLPAADHLQDEVSAHMGIDSR